MKKWLVVTLCLSMLLLAVCGVHAEDAGYKEEVVQVKGENYDIPATVCIPTGEGKFPAVVMLHGTGSTRDEAGDGYKIAAPILASKYGIATIRIDFPGNGESKADYMQYNFHSAVADAKTAADYIAGLEKIDSSAIGVMGWSQGGTDALLACAWEPQTFKSLVTWAGAPDLMDGDFFTQEMYDEAKENGYFVMKFDWRDPLNVSLKWCNDVANTNVLDEFSKGYTGPVLAIAGDKDDTVNPEWSNKIAAASVNPKSGTYFIEGMDHTFNVFSEEDHHSLLDAVNATGRFFQETLGNVNAQAAPEAPKKTEAQPVKEASKEPQKEAQPTQAPAQPEKEESENDQQSDAGQSYEGRQQQTVYMEDGSAVTIYFDEETASWVDGNGLVYLPMAGALVYQPDTDTYWDADPSYWNTYDADDMDYDRFAESINQDADGYETEETRSMTVYREDGSYMTIFYDPATDTWTDTHGNEYLPMAGSLVYEPNNGGYWSGNPDYWNEYDEEDMDYDAFDENRSNQEEAQIYGLESQGSGRPVTVTFSGGAYYGDDGLEYYNQNDGTFMDENGDMYNVVW